MVLAVAQAAAIRVEIACRKHPVPIHRPCVSVVCPHHFPEDQCYIELQSASSCFFPTHTRLGCCEDLERPVKHPLLLVWLRLYRLLVNTMKNFKIGEKE